MSIDTNQPNPRAHSKRNQALLKWNLTSLFLSLSWLRHLALAPQSKVWICDIMFWQKLIEFWMLDVHQDSTVFDGITNPQP